METALQGISIEFTCGAWLLVSKFIIMFHLAVHPVSRKSYFILWMKQLKFKEANICLRLQS